MLTISNIKAIIKEVAMDSRDKRLVEIILRYREELQRKIKERKVEMESDNNEHYMLYNALVQKFLNKWTIFLFCSILFSSNQKEH